MEESRNAGYKIAIASSSRREWVTTYLETLDLLHYFQVIITQDDSRVKPAPDLYLKAISDLHISPSEALAFEDSLNGCKAAVTAGIKCVIVPNPVTEFLAFESYELRLNSMAEKSLAEVIEIIEK